jgi:hypothetical protein
MKGLQRRGQRSMIAFQSNGKTKTFYWMFFVSRGALNGQDRSDFLRGFPA